MMLEWTDKHPFTVETIGVMTGWGSNGTWTILNDNVKGMYNRFMVFNVTFNNILVISGVKPDRTINNTAYICLKGRRGS